MKQKIYLEDVPLDEAMATFEAALKEAGLWDPLPSETVSVAESCGRITAEAVWAKISAPHYNASAMDGFALRSQDTEGATETNPIRFTLLDPSDPPPDNERYALVVDTGQPLPAWADAVVMVEHVQRISDALGEPAIEIRASLPPWHHVRLMGEDMVATELVLPANHRLRPVDLGAIAGSGHGTVKVFRNPRVAIIPTGTELVTVDGLAKTGISPGKIIEYNSIVLAAQVVQWGGIPTRWPIVPDDYAAIQDAVIEATLKHDLILVNAGSSAGTRDFTADVVDSLGKLLVHGVAVRPGHPVILGMIGKGNQDQQQNGYTHHELAGSGDIEPNHDLMSSHAKSATTDIRQLVPIIGVPGYPVSAALTGEIFVEPLLARWQGLPSKRSPVLRATVTRKVMSHTGDDDFVRVSVGKVGDRYMATPISRGAGVITSLVRADGIVRIPRFSEGLEAGSEVKVHLYRTPEEIAQTIVAIGSHDLTLDILSQFLSARGKGQRLSSANVGSLGGLIALRRGEAHIAGTHLLDPESGDYNRSYVKRYLPGRELVLISLVEREQGWIVPTGNPRGLCNWEDIEKPGVQIINRQRGAGTRVLLDYELEKRGIKSGEVLGYDKEVYTHLAVAAAVASGIVDMGLGIAAAARALQLDFVPLANEQYDLVLSREDYESDLLQPLLELLVDSEFRSAAMAMPGYDVSHMGEVRTVNT
ncbi:MAG: molybdopterin biosynthesis protein [Candidatus Promineifilaceae bacterium]